MNRLKMKKCHISVFTTNILALVLAIFFIKGYRLRGISITNVVVIVLILLLVFVLTSIFILKPHGKIKNLFPKRSLLLLNISISAAFSLFFLKQIGLMGFLFVMVFSFLLFEAEHIIYEGLGR